MTREELAVSLKEYFDMRITNMENALVLARGELNLRLDSFNELRQAKNQTWIKVAGMLLVLGQVISPILLYYILHK